VQLDLTDDERAALTKFLRDGIERDRFPLSPRPALPEPRSIVPPRASARQRRNG
jgi:hypothetical protein